MKLRNLFFASCLLGCSANVAWAGALDQATGWADPSYRPGNIPTPTFKCVENCGTGTSTKTPSPRTTTVKRSPSYGYKPSMAVGAAVFGSLLESVLFAPPSGPSPAELRRQEEARRQAEEEARLRAEEERLRHEHLLASLKSLPLTRSFTATQSAQGTTELGLTALNALDSPGALANSIRGPLDGAAEKLRSEASLGWDTAADTRFAVRWQPLPLSKSATIPFSRALCQQKQCSWPSEPGNKLPSISKQKDSKHVLGRDEVVQLLRKPSAAGLAPDAALITGLMTRDPDPPGLLARYLMDERLKKFAREAGKELLWVFVARLLDEKGGTLGKGITLMRDVNELATTDMKDAISVAGWLGSSNLENPPEITSPEEASIPFLNRALGTSTVFGEGAANYVSAGIDATQLANKLLSLWKEAQ